MMHYGYIQVGLDPPLLACIDRVDGAIHDENACPDDDSDYGLQLLLNPLLRACPLRKYQSPAKPACIMLSVL